MNWTVTSTISGGQAYRIEDLNRLGELAHRLHEQSSDIDSLGRLWAQLPLELAVTRSGGGIAAAGAPSAGVQEAINEQAASHALACSRLSAQLELTADRIIRAYSLYSEAEHSARAAVNRLWQLLGLVSPTLFLLGAAGVLTSGAIRGGLDDHRLGVVQTLGATGWAHEGLVLGLSAPSAVLGPRGWTPSTQVNRAAGLLSGISAPIVNGIQGNTLTLTKVESNTPVVPASQTVAQALEGLRRLAEERLGTIDLNSGLSYGTVAIQRYRRADGTNAWLVSIPGTDGRSDSPFGWPQNLELMSNNPQQRMQADSARMVAAAMDSAGIARDEPVAIIGHSQGGIVAAVIASDMSARYNVQHVVTAGSPIANHPVNGRTWVTGIEMDDELVAALDGSPNPHAERWLTIRGHATRASGPGSVAGGSDAGTPVVGTKGVKEITHWLKYHQAAYGNAIAVGSPAVAAHERHFQEVISGDLADTTYW